MSFQDEYKITNADRVDKGVYGLPDTPGMTTAAIQERFDSLGNLAIDKFNALVDAASDTVDDSETKFPTNKAVTDYISGQGGAIIDDDTPSLHKAYSSQKVENMFGDVASRVIDDETPSTVKTYSSAEIEEKLSDIPSPESIIDDDTASTDTTYSSSKLESDFISVSDTEEQTATDEFTTINGGLLSSLKVSLSPNQDLHGYDSPWVGGAGKNKLANVLSELKSNNTSGTWSGNVYTINGGTIEILTDNADNILGYKINGTFTGTVSFLLAGTAYKLLSEFANNSIFTISQEVEASGINGFCLQRQEAGSNIYISNNQTYTNVDPSGDTTNHYRPILRFNNGDSIANKTYVLMIRNSADSSDFAPYSNICPISGHTEAEIWNHQKNLFNGVFADYMRINDSGATEYNDQHKVSGDYIPVLPNTSYVLSGENIGQRYNGLNTANVRYAFYDFDKNFLYLSSSFVGPESVTFTTTAVTKYVKIQCGGNAANVQLELGSTATAYEPYNGYQVTVNLGGTYYSGTLDVVSGVFTPTHVMWSDDGSKNWARNADGSFYVFYTDTHPLAVQDAEGCSCDYAPFVLSFDGMSVFARANGLVSLGRGWGNIYPDVPTLKAQFAIKPFQMVYKLATPTPIQLSPTMVKALVGENHLSAPLEGQEITESVYSPLAKWNAVIDDTTASDDTTYSSNKINAIVPKIDDNATSATKVFSSLKTAALITELSERFDFSTTEKPIGWWTDGKVYYGKVIHINGCPKEMFGLVVDLGVEVDTFIGLFAVGNASDDNYNGGYCMGGTIYCKVTKSEGQNTQIQPACAVMALSSADLLVLYTKVE